MPGKRFIILLPVVLVDTSLRRKIGPKAKSGLILYPNRNPKARLANRIWANTLILKRSAKTDLFLCL